MPREATEGEDSVGPVSYTHLDVYKRQALDRLEQEVKRQFKESLEAVSYTHLDVYKRQGLRYRLLLAMVNNPIGRALADRYTDRLVQR